MIKIRKAQERGATRIGWLDSKHTFSFGSYYDPAHTHFGALRVINDDRVAPGAGFGEHGHKDMEIISYVVDGALEHRDSMGNGSVLRAGDVQLMRAGRGVRHSEFNGSKTEPVRFLQIWIPPDAIGLAPAYAEMRSPALDRPNEFHRIIAPIAEAGEDELGIHQDASLWAARLEPGRAATMERDAGRRTWIQIVNGAGALNGEPVSEGDGAALTKIERFHLEAGEAGIEAIVFDLA